MSEQEKPREGIHVSITGDVSGQVAVGQDITQTQMVGAVTEADPAALRQALAEFKAQVAAQAPADKKDAALERVEELEEAVTSKEPDLTMMEYVKRWFVKNLPGLAGSVTAIVVHPIVGKLVAAAGDAVVREFNRRFGE